MSDRLPAGVLVGALLRRVNDSGGIATVLAKGDPQAGAILVVMLDKGRNARAIERGIGQDGKIGLIAAGPQSGEREPEVTEYWSRRRSSDPDLWVIELDIPSAERFVAETLLDN